MTIPGRLGFYEIDPDVSPSPIVKTSSGPWAGNYMIDKVPALSSELHISKDYARNGPTYSTPDTTCYGSSVLRGIDQSYYSLNRSCGTTGGMWATERAIEVHEREHESGYNECLSTARAIAQIEALTGKGSLSSAAASMWRTFYRQTLAKIDPRAGAFDGGTQTFWFRGGGGWAHGLMTIPSHGSPMFCN